METRYGTTHRGVILSYSPETQSGVVRVFLFEDPLVTIDKPFDRGACDDGIVPCVDLYLLVTVRNSTVVFMQEGGS